MHLASLLVDKLVGLNHKSRCLVAFSGGGDSHVLLHALKSVEPAVGMRVEAIHVHHGLMTVADQWVTHCQSICSELDVPLQVHYVDAKAEPGHSPEASARHARYAVFASVLETDDVLVTGHHQRDQAETLLLQLMRGAGPSGLAAMPQQAPLGLGMLVRPMLEAEHDVVRRYALDNKLVWIEDPSNESTEFDRNFLRHKVMPLLQQRWPACDKTIARSARHCAEAAEIVAGLTRAWLQQCQVEGHDECLSAPQWRALAPHQQRLVLRAWFRASGVAIASTAVLEQMIQQFMSARADANPCVNWDDVELRLYQDVLYLRKQVTQTPHVSDLSWNVRDRQSIRFAHRRLRATRSKGSGIAERFIDPELNLSLRNGGERCLMANDKHKKLKILLQELEVPPWTRDELVLISANGAVIAIPGLWVSKRVVAGADEWGYDISLDK